MIHIKLSNSFITKFFLFHFILPKFFMRQDLGQSKPMQGYRWLVIVIPRPPWAERVFAGRGWCVGAVGGMLVYGITETAAMQGQTGQSNGPPAQSVFPLCCVKMDFTFSDSVRSTLHLPSMILKVSLINGNFLKLTKIQ